MRTTTTARPPALTPTQRAAVRVRLAHRLGDGLPVTRAQVLAELRLTPAPAVSPDRTINVDIVNVDRPAGPACQGATPAPAVVFVEPVTPDRPAVTPDAVVSFAAAASRLGVSVATARRYAAPSSGKLTRAGDGVTLASVEALAGAR
jgi:hypothetical protein